MPTWFTRSSRGQLRDENDQVLAKRTIHMYACLVRRTKHERCLFLHRVRSKVRKHSGWSIEWNISRSDVDKSWRGFPSVCLYVSRWSLAASRSGFHFLRSSRESAGVSFLPVRITPSVSTYLYTVCLLNYWFTRSQCAARFLTCVWQWSCHWRIACVSVT